MRTASRLWIVANQRSLHIGLSTNGNKIKKVGPTRSQDLTAIHWATEAHTNIQREQITHKLKGVGNSKQRLLVRYKRYCVARSPRVKVICHILILKQPQSSWVKALSSHKMLSIQKSTISGKSGQWPWVSAFKVMLGQRSWCQIKGHIPVSICW